MKKDLYVADSKIAGKGVFTKKPILKGQTVFIMKGEKHHKVNKNISDVMGNPNWVGLKENVWIDPIGFFQYINHSCDPNMGIKGSVTFVALRNIKATEELTYDYSIAEDDTRWRMKNSEKLRNKKKYRSTIKSIQHLPKTVYKRYLPYIPKYFQKVYNLANQ